MIMSVRKSLTTVTLMPLVPTFLEASPVPVTKDTVEMELFVLVGTKTLAINIYNLYASIASTCNSHICYLYLTDIDECETGTDNCDVDATCTNIAGNFTCTCNLGYRGDGVSCDGGLVYI